MVNSFVRNVKMKEEVGVVMVVVVVVKVVVVVVVVVVMVVVVVVEGIISAFNVFFFY